MKSSELESKLKHIRNNVGDLPIVIGNHSKVDVKLLDNGEDPTAVLIYPLDGTEEVELRPVYSDDGVVYV